MTVWRSYLPEYGDTVNDAWDIPYRAPLFYGQKPRPPLDADQAAEWAVEHSYKGDDPMDTPIHLVVIDPQGQEHHYDGYHFVSIEHSAYKREESK